MQKTKLYFLLIFSLTTLAASCADDDDNDKANGIDLQDQALIDCILEAIGDDQTELTAENLDGLQNLNCADRQISDISGIGSLSNLRTLSLWENQIADISPIVALTSLTDLELGNNQIQDLEAIQELSQLSRLGLSYNSISDVSVLGDLSELIWLNLDANNITNVDSLASMSNITWLTIQKNSLDDDSVLDALQAAGAHVYYEPLVPTSKSPHSLLMEKHRHPDAEMIIPEHANFIDDESYETLASIYGDQWFALDPHLLASPNQEGAGTCIFMANTGAMEVLINQHHTEEITYNGDTDLSERYMLNATFYGVPNEETDGWYYFTDLQWVFNYYAGALLNNVFPYTAGWILDDGAPIPNEGIPGDEGSILSVDYNWIDGLPDDFEDLLIPTPEVDRTIIYVDPAIDENQSPYAVAGMNQAVGARIKYTLRERSAPVILIYTHYDVWHTVMVVGYDDTETSEAGCPMVEDILDQFAQYAQEAEASGNSSAAAEYQAKIDAVEGKMADTGGCADFGAFLVRDSIYDGTDDLIYEYSDEYSAPYSKRIVKHSYDWARLLGNHAYVVHRI